MDTTREQMADKFKADILETVIALLKLVQTEIDDNCLSEDPSDNTPQIQITIACNDNFTDWAYQTGDNGYAGPCYGFPNWGVTSITREAYTATEVKTIASNLIDDMINQAF